MDYGAVLLKNLEKILNYWILINDQDQILQCGKLFLKQLGYEESELLEQPITSILPQDDQSRFDFINKLKTRTHQGTSINQKGRLKQKNGVIIDIELSMYCLSHEKQHFWLITFDNITEVVELQKLVNHKMAAMYTKFNMVFDEQIINHLINEIADAVLVSITAGQGLRFNRAFLFFVDFVQDELRGVNAIGPGSGEEAGDIYRNFSSAPKTLTEMIGHYRTLKDTDSQVNNFIQSLKFSLKDKDNFLIQILNSKKYLLVNNDSVHLNPEGINWLRETFGVEESVVVPLVWHDTPIGIILADNQVTRSPITSSDIKKLTRFSSTAANSIETIKLLINIEKYFNQLQAANLKIRESQAILLQKEKLAALGEVVAHMAHEVRGPLSIIGGYAQRIFKDMPTESAHYDSMRRIVETAQTLELVLRDILDNSSTPTAPEVSCDCGKTINKVIGLFEDEMNQRDISVTLNLQGNTPKIHIKEHHLFEITSNLIHNAIEAIDTKGILSIATKLDSNQVIIQIQDSGIGIAPENIEKIFQPFYTTKKNGTGLGLPVIKKLIEDNKGQIKVSSPVNLGTTFTLYFPY